MESMKAPSDRMGLLHDIKGQGEETWAAEWIPVWCAAS